MVETIVAVSSPPTGNSLHTAGTLPFAMVRLSGPNAAMCADAVFVINRPETSTRSREKNDSAPGLATLVAALVEKKWRRIAGRVRWRATELMAHAYLMPSPRSYTRDDVVELHVPGLPWLIDDLLDALIAAGARAAQPGEFTRRAFENGRITLEQAETVGKLIASSSAQEARAHAANLTAHAGVQRRKLKKDLEDLLAQVELGLDFAHEDVVVISLDDMAARMEELRARAVKLAEDSTRETERAVTSRAPRIVIAGPTNAGKSLLFNTLLKREAAIVSAERHTTRDAVEAPLFFQDGALSAVLVDSAGSGGTADRETGNSGAREEIFSAAWSATRGELATADVLLLALDRSVPLDDQEGLPALFDAIRKLKPAVAAVVWTKSDLPAATNWSADAPIEFAATARFDVSAFTGKGIDALSAFLAQRTGELTLRIAEAHAAAGASIRAAAHAAAEALTRASEALRDGCGEDVVAVELREAIHAFWRAEGILMRHDAVTEAALDTIFSQFCIGK